MDATKSGFFEDIAISMDSWAEAASDTLTVTSTDLVWTEEPEVYQRIQQALVNAGVDKDDLKRVFAECLRGFAVSILTVIDGGTALAENGRIHLVDGDGNSLGEGLHDDFINYLLETGRLQ